MSNFPNHTLLDAVNVDILKALAATPRMTTAELARAVGMSGPAVRERMQRLEETGVIRGFRLDLDSKLLGYPVEAFIRVRPMPGRLPKIVELAQSMPRVVECHRITGEDCFIMRVHLESVEALDSILDVFLAHGQTATSLVQSTPVPRRSLPLPDVG
ncbi:MAG: Lrp/AsnC family transcriptional regulator [Vulcanimicrobiaceae bacterium]